MNISTTCIVLFLNIFSNSFETIHVLCVNSFACLCSPCVLRPVFYPVLYTKKTVLGISKLGTFQLLLDFSIQTLPKGSFKEPYAVRSKTITSGEIVEKDQQIFLSNRRLKSREIAVAMKISLNARTHRKRIY